MGDNASPGGRITRGRGKSSRNIPQEPIPPTPSVSSRHLPYLTASALRDKLSAIGVAVPSSWSRKQLAQLYDENKARRRQTSATITSAEQSSEASSEQPEVTTQSVSGPNSAVNRREFNELKDLVTSVNTTLQRLAQHSMIQPLTQPITQQSHNDPNDDLISPVSYQPPLPVSSNSLPYIDVIPASLTKRIQKDVPVQSTGSISRQGAHTTSNSLRSSVDLTTPLQDMWTASIGKKTAKAYLTGLRCYQSFLVTRQVLQPAQQSILNTPLDEHHLQAFLAYCLQTLNLAFTTVKTYLAGIRFWALQAGIACPLTTHNSMQYTRLQTLLRGYKKLQTEQPTTRLPITFPILSKIIHVLRASLFGQYMDLLMETMCCAAFFGFLRCGELTCDTKFNENLNLCVGDVCFNLKEQNYILRLKASKTDPFRKGVNVRYFATNLSICAYQSMYRFVNIRRVHGARDCDALFVDQAYRPMTRVMFLDHLHTILKRAGLNADLYSGHSFRIGAATSAAEARIEDHLIKTLGRWTSDCYTRYIHTPRSVLQQAQRSMCT